jgi:hypothetical protein
VLFDGDTEAKSIHPNNLTKEEDAKPGSPSPFQVGHRVVVSGLKNQTALNGVRSVLLIPLEDELELGGNSNTLISF